MTRDWGGSCRSIDASADGMSKMSATSLYSSLLWNLRDIRLRNTKSIKHNQALGLFDFLGSGTRILIVVHQEESEERHQSRESLHSLHVRMGGA
jgi:hypothetical protein